MSGLDYSKQFGSVFRLEVHAVECRRRRLRIEGTLGFLPGLPKQLPAEVTASPEASPAPVPRERLEQQRVVVEESRRRLAEARRPQQSEASAAPPPPAQASPAEKASPPRVVGPSETQSPVVAAARDYRDKAREWYRLADANRGASWTQYNRAPDQRARMH